MNQDELITELKRVSAQLGRDSFSRTEFKRYGRVSAGLVERRFGTWNKALEAAGLVPIDRFKRIADAELQEEFHRVCTKLGKVPTRNEFAMESKLSPSVYERRFQNWRGVLGHYLGPKVQEAPLTARKPVESTPPLATPYKVGPSPSLRTPDRSKRVFGRPLNFRELRHEPINEQGVVYLFGMVARELGFLVEGVATEFPDCDAKRLTRGGLYEPVRIEFEFKARNFYVHGHDPTACQLIVCWEDDWPECPVEVLELKQEIKKLPA